VLVWEQHLDQCARIARNSDAGGFDDLARLIGANEELRDPFPAAYTVP
jgi:hypothetical protein